MIFATVSPLIGGGCALDGLHLPPFFVISPVRWNHFRWRIHGKLRVIPKGRDIVSDRVNSRKMLKGSEQANDRRRR